MRPEKTGVFRKILLLLLFLVAAAGLLYIIQKINHKVNSLHNAVVSLEGYVDQTIEINQSEMEEVHSDIKEIQSEIEEIRLYIEEEKTASEAALFPIPDLDPHVEGWKITQFGDALAREELFYTITTGTGLAIVDGGWEYEEDRIRRIIAKYGNCVDAWILTHPHDDHITAFLDIYKNLDGIAIHHIYTPEMPDLSILKKNAGWEDYSMLQELWDFQIPQLEYLHPGDERKILGLDMKVLSAYEDEIDDISDDLLNDGSLMFRLSGKKDSMLFFADVGGPVGNEALSKRIIERYRNDLKSDYMQISHHGFGGLSHELYDLVDAKAVFFDSPAWHLTNTGRISSRDNNLRMEEQGRMVFTYFTAPNQILLH